nr:chaperone modulator CbpM [Wenzhouxiangella limi]
MDADLDDICRICGLEVEELRQWIEEGVAEPRSIEARQWRFSARQLRRVRVGRRLRRDLEIDARALPVVLDLIEEVETLRQRVRLLERVIED